jgi:membrane protease YdiL (CAAX protease family)
MPPKSLKKVKHWQIAVALIAAGVFWFFLFSPKFQSLNFWTALPVAATLLAAWAIYCGGVPFERKQCNLMAVGIGTAAALMLYVIFILGNFFAGLLFDFAPGQVNSIYAMKESHSRLLIALMLLFVSSPAEEIFWRGFLQKWMMSQWGAITGWLMASLCYAAVHIVSGNFILVMAALVCGLFWGLLYLWLKGNLVPVIISHSLWTFGIFVVFPVV